MKVLLVGRFYGEAFATFIAEELEALGHDVLPYHCGPRMVDFGSRTRFYVNRILGKGFEAARALKLKFGGGSDLQGLRKLIEREGPVDLTLVTHDYLTPAEATGVKNLTKAPLVLWYPDPIWCFQRHMFLNGPYDALFFKDPYIVDILRRKLNAPVHYLPECYSPRSLEGDLDGASPDSGYAADICTAGSLYAYRVAFYRNLLGNKIRIWGTPPPLWMSVGPIAPMVQNRFVAHGEKVKAFRGAKIVLNNLNPAEIWGTNVRTFEICGARGFQITDWRPGLSQLFELGRELVTFDDVSDLKSKIDHYLAAPEERQAIAEAGYRRAAREHTYAHRLRLLIDTVAGREKGFPEPRIAWADGHAHAG